MFARAALLATAALGFVVALVEPRGAEPSLPEALCLILAILAVVLAAAFGVAAARARLRAPQR